MTIEKRGKAKPPREYILGKAVFMGNEFLCTTDTLIPTEDTHVLVDVATDHARKAHGPDRPVTIVEIGTGCGNIAISLALRLKNAKIHASDISPGAVEVARRNVEKYDLRERVSLHCGDMFLPLQDLGLQGAVDLVVCNPPYIPTSSLTRLPPEIVEFEPMVALDGGPYGIDAYRKLIKAAREFLPSHGMLLFEIGERQEKLVARLLDKDGGYQDIAHYRKDGKVRVMGARRR